METTVVGGRYRLEHRLGAGGMSDVWSAEDLELGRRVALKLLGPNADRERFAREARAAAGLTHPNIVSLYDYGEADGRPFMVLELLTGGTLEARLAAGRPLDDAAAARIAAEVAAGLAHAHARGLVHRDLKPANVLFDGEGHAKIADFGIARVEGGGTLTEAGTVLGTAAYISPEQAAGRPAGPASDVYSFGVMLYRMLTGRLPFASSDPIELVIAHRDRPPPPLSALRRDAPPALAALAERALAKDPAQRPADGAALAATLAGAPSSPAGATRVLPAPPTQVLPARPPTQRPPPARSGSRRSRALAGLVALAALAAAGVAVAIVGAGGGDSSAPPTTRATRPVRAATRPAPATTTPGRPPPVPTAATTSAAATTRPERTTAPATTAEPRPTTTAPPPTTAPATSPLPPTTAEPATTFAPPATTTAPPPTTTAPAPTTDTAPPPTTTAPPPDTTTAAATTPPAAAATQ